MEARTAQAEADRLLREARNHKRASRRHREQAREKREQLCRLIAACEQRGITVTINTEPEGGHGGNHKQEQQAQDPKAAAA